MSKVFLKNFIPVGSINNPTTEISVTLIYVSHIKLSRFTDDPVKVAMPYDDMLKELDALKNSKLYHIQSVALSVFLEVVGLVNRHGYRMDYPNTLDNIQMLYNAVVQEVESLHKLDGLRDDVKTAFNFARRKTDIELELMSVWKAINQLKRDVVKQPAPAKLDNTEYLNSLPIDEFYTLVNDVLLKVEKLPTFHQQVLKHMMLAFTSPKP